MKKVSVVTVTYNLLKSKREDVFKEMFLSLHNQTYPDIEHVIIDGNSADGTQDFIKNIISEFGKKEVTFISEDDNGINDATNKGLALAKGDYLMIMCSDDYYTRLDAIELLVKACEKKKSDFACGDCWWLEEKVWKAKPDSYVYKHPFVINTLLMKREVFENIGGLDDAFGIASDYEFFFRLMIKYPKGAVVHKILTALRPGGVSGSNRRVKEILKCYYAIYEKYYRECKFAKYEMNNLVCSYEKPFSVGTLQILKILFRMKNTRTKWLLLRHFNIFYYISHVIYKICRKFAGILIIIYLASRTELLK